MILTPFRLSQITCFTLHNSLKYFPSVSTSCPGCEDLSPTSPPQLGAGWSCSLSFFSLLSFILLSCAWNHVFFSSGQGLLPVFSWYSVTNAAICRCILDASMESDVLHIQLLLCHLSRPNKPKSQKLEKRNFIAGPCKMTDGSYFKSPKPSKVFSKTLSKAR